MATKQRLYKAARVLFSCLLVVTDQAFAQTRPLPVPDLPDGQSSGFWAHIRHPYEDREVPPVNFANSNRIETLIRGGNLYLTLSDTIALALENNLDIELQRYGPQIANTDILRAQSGNLLRGLTLSVREGPNGVGGPQSTATQGISVQPGQTVDTNLSISTQNGLSTGPLPPSLDPAIVGQFDYLRNSAPQSSTFITGTNSLITHDTIGNVSLQKGFLTGGMLGVGFNNTRANVNNLRADINPATTSNLGVTFTQPLLRGFGFALNNRFIRIAKNDRTISDLAFQQQVISTVYAAVRLYWDLVSLNEDLKVRRESLTLANQLLENNRQQVEAGTLAPIEVVRAQAQVSQSQRDVLIGETLVRQEETVLKDYITRNYAFDPLLAEVRVIPTDIIQLPDNEPIQPIQDLITSAYNRRPDLIQARIQLQNSDISLRGSKNALLPQLDFVASTQGNALYGQTNPLPPISTGTGTTGSTNPATLVRNPDPNLLGGLGTGLGQIFGLKFPNYEVGLQLTIPIGNRAAIADVVRDKLSVRQQEIRLHQLEKQVQVDVQNALIAVQQTRSAYQAAREQRVLQEQTLEAEQQKLAVGLSTTYLVIQYQRDLEQARAGEVASLGDYAKARAGLQRALGSILGDYNVDVADVYSGHLTNSPKAP